MDRNIIIMAIVMTGFFLSCDPKPKASVEVEKNAETEQSTNIEPPPGGISLAELFANRKKYEGQTVKVKGKCIKLNNMIMNRNWIHLQDGSLNDGTSDLTVTTTENISLGTIVALEGTIALNKDFGAGYVYEIIMEDAKLLQ